MPTTRNQQLYLARRKATHLYILACRERDTKGMRENLGYDSARTLDDYLDTLDLLTYQDKHIVTTEFFHLCDRIVPQSFTIF